MGLDFEVQYKKGMENKLANAISKRQEEDSTVMAMSKTQHTWLQEVSHSYKGDPIALQLFKKLIVSFTGLSDYTLYQGIIQFKHKVYMGKGNDLRLKNLEIIHQSSLGAFESTRDL